MRVLVITKRLPRQDSNGLRVVRPGDPLLGERVDAIVALDPLPDPEWWGQALSRLAPDGRVFTL